MKNGSTLFLKIVIILIGLAVLALCIFILPAGIFSKNPGLYRPILIGMYLPAIPFYIGMFQTLKLLSYVDANKAFSHSSVKSLGYIKYCAFIVGGLYAVGLPFIFLAAQQDDAPGVALIGLIFTFLPLSIGTFAAVFEKVLKDAIEIKQENEQTV